MDVRVFLQDRDERAGREGRGVLSFGYFSLHKQRKVTRSQERKLLNLLFLLLLLLF